jgi:hypothetical protein
VAVADQLSARLSMYKVVEARISGSSYRHLLFALLALWPSFCAMLEFSDSSAKLVGPAGSILVPDDDEITRKLAMLFEGQCEGLGPTEAARRYGLFQTALFSAAGTVWDSRRAGASKQASRTKDQLSTHR